MYSLQQHKYVTTFVIKISSQLHFHCHLSSYLPVGWHLLHVSSYKLLEFSCSIPQSKRFSWLFRDGLTKNHSTCFGSEQTRNKKDVYEIGRSVGQMSCCWRWWRRYVHILCKLISKVLYLNLKLMISMKQEKLLCWLPMQPRCFLMVGIVTTTSSFPWFDKSYDIIDEWTNKLYYIPMVYDNFEAPVQVVVLMLLLLSLFVRLSIFNFIF